VAGGLRALAADSGLKAGCDQRVLNGLCATGTTVTDGGLYMVRAANTTLTAVELAIRRDIGEHAIPGPDEPQSLAIFSVVAPGQPGAALRNIRHRTSESGH